jgi:hypothetical protein
MCVALLIGAVIILGNMFSKSAREKGTAVSSAVQNTHV